MVWLNVEGLSLHAWSLSIIINIASKWGKVVESEDLTKACRQIHIGRILVHTMIQESICDLVNLSIDGIIYPMRVMEDFIEVIDVGPRYDLGDSQSRSSIESDNQWLDAGPDSSSDDDCVILESPQALVATEKLNG